MRWLVRGVLLPSWSNVICLSDGNNSHFLAVAVEQKATRLLLFQLTLQPASLRLLYKLPKQKSVQRSLADCSRFVAGLGDKQTTTSNGNRCPTSLRRSNSCHRPRARSVHRHCGLLKSPSNKASGGWIVSRFIGPRCGWFCRTSSTSDF